MKTTKLYLSIALVALTITSFAKTSESSDLAMEQDLFLESWMASPFESAAIDNELVLENWMTSPFEMGIEIEGLQLECWMTTPFEVTEDRGVEVWMAASWD